MLPISASLNLFEANIIKFYAVDCWAPLNRHLKNCSPNYKSDAPVVKAKSHKITQSWMKNRFLYFQIRSRLTQTSKASSPVDSHLKGKAIAAWLFSTHWPLTVIKTQETATRFLWEPLRTLMITNKAYLIFQSPFNTKVPSYVYCGLHSVQITHLYLMTFTLRPLFFRPPHPLMPLIRFSLRFGPLWLLISCFLVQL